MHEVTDEVVEAFSVLLPQLSRSAPPADRAVLERVASSAAATLLIARSDGKISGHAVAGDVPDPHGMRAWIEDVIVDEAARGQGIGQILTIEALRIAEQAGARTVDLTSRPSREAAGRLYERVGFQSRSTRLYRYTFADHEAADSTPRAVRLPPRRHHSPRGLRADCAVGWAATDRATDWGCHGPGDYPARAATASSSRSTSERSL